MKTSQITEAQLQRRAKFNICCLFITASCLLVALTFLNVPLILICASGTLFNFTQLRRNVARMALFHPEWDGMTIASRKEMKK